MPVFEKGLIRLIPVVLVAAWVRPGALPEVEPIYLVSHGWHVGLVIRHTDATAAHWPEQADFPGAAFLEVGWGDSDFYQDPDPGLGTLLKAGLWPTKSVLHVVGLTLPVTAYFPRSEIIRLDVPEAGLAALAAYVHDAYARGEDGRPIVLGPGLYGESRFYAGQGRYHVFKNCNTWAARALRAAGVAIRPAEIVTANDLLAQARPFGETIQQAE